LANRNKIFTGLDAITDNWTFKVVADYLNNVTDPNEEVKFIVPTSHAALKGSIKAGVFQIDCLINLIEQIIFTDSLFIRQEWLPLWTNRDTPLDLLLKENNFIQPIKINDYNIEEEKKVWINELVKNDFVRRRFEASVENYKIKCKNKFLSFSN
jgi:hypothetical protein